MAFYKCPRCQETVTSNMGFCWNCQTPLEAPVDLAPPTQNHPAPDFTIDCTLCQLEGAMIATKVSRFSFVIIVIGIILLVPSFIGILIGVIGIIVSMVAGAGIGSSEGAFVAGLGMFTYFILIIVSFTGGLLGWLLIDTKKVWRCVRCGYILERA